MRIPYFVRLEEQEKRLYDKLMEDMEVEVLNCWNLKAPEDFEKIEPCEDLLNDSN